MKFLSGFLLALHIFLLSGNANLYAEAKHYETIILGQGYLTHSNLSNTESRKGSQSLCFREAPNKSRKSSFDFIIDFAEVEEEEDKSGAHKKLLERNPYYTSLFLAHLAGFFFETELNQRFTFVEHFSLETSCKRHVMCQVFRI